MLTGNLDPAIFGLVGVIIGGIITAGSNYLLESRRERAVMKRDNYNYTIEIKRAARLIDDDLSYGIAVAQICIDNRHWWSTDVRPLTIEGWQQNRGIVAAELSDNAWLAVRVAVEAVDNLKTSRDIGIEYGISKISNKTAKQILSMLNHIEAGRSALAPFMTSTSELFVK